MLRNLRAIGAGAATSDQATKSEVLASHEGEAFELTSTASQDDLVDTLAADQAKAVAALGERLVLAGWALTLGVEPATYLAIRWGQTRMLRGLSEVEAFARQVGASA